MHNTENGTRNTKHDLVSKTVATMDPLDPVKDSAAVRALATETGLAKILVKPKVTDIGRASRVTYNSPRSFL